MAKREQYKTKESYDRQKRIGRQRYYDKTSNLYPRSYFTDNEDSMILAHDVTDYELSRMIRHSVKSIQSRRGRLNRMYKSEECRTEV